MPIWVLDEGGGLSWEELQGQQDKPCWTKYSIVPLTSHFLICVLQIEGNGRGRGLDGDSTKGGEG